MFIYRNIVVKYRTLSEKGLCGFSWEGCWVTGVVSETLVGVSPEDPEVTEVGGPISAGLSPPDVDEEGDLTLPCNQPKHRALLSTWSPHIPSPICHQSPHHGRTSSRPSIRYIQALNAKANSNTCKYFIANGFLHYLYDLVILLKKYSRTFVISNLSQLK